MAGFTNIISAALFLYTLNSTEIIQRNSFSGLETKIAQTEIDKEKVEKVMEIQKETQNYLTRHFPNLAEGVMLTGGYCEVPEPKVPAPRELKSEYGPELSELPYFFDNWRLSLPSLKTIANEIIKCAKAEIAYLQNLAEGHEAELPKGLKYGVIEMQAEIKAESLEIRVYQMINLTKTALPGKREFYLIDYAMEIPSRIAALRDAAQEYLNNGAFAFPNVAEEISKKYDIEFRLFPLEDMGFKDSRIIGVTDKKSYLKFLFAGRGMGDGI